MKKNLALTKITIIMASFFMMADVFIVSPVMGEVAKAFPDASGAVIGLCYTISQICIIPVAFACGKLATVFSKKTLMIFGAVLVAIGGGLGGLYLNITYILVMRAIEGLGAGFCITLAPAVIAEIFPDEKEMTRMNGFFGATGAIIGCIVSMLSGKIAVAVSWQSSYFIYLFSIVVLIMIIAFIPKTPPEKVQEKATRARMNKAAWLWGVEVFVFAILTNGVFMLVAAYISEKGVGDADVAGTWLALETFSCFFGGVVLVWVISKLKEFTTFLCYLLISIAMSFTMFFNSSVLVLTGGLIWGLGYGIFFPYIFAKATILASPNSETHTLSITNAFYYLGMGLTAFLFDFIGKIFNDSSVSYSFQFLTIASAVLTAYYIAQGFVRNTKKEAFDTNKNIVLKEKYKYD